MKLPQIRAQELKWASALLLILGAAFTFYFFHFVSGQSKYLRDRNLRELATLSRQIEKAFTDLQTGQNERCEGGAKESDQELDVAETPWLEIVPLGATNLVRFSFPRKCRIALRDILQPIAWPDDLFDQFLLVDQESRRVLFRLTSPAVKLASLELGDSKPLPSQSHYQVLEIGGRAYELFLQPVLVRSSQATLERPTTPLTLALVGLVASDSLLAEAGRIPLALLVGMLSIAVLLILLLPFLKIGLQASHERLRKLDLIQIAVASAFGLALAVILCLELWAHHALRADINEGLKVISHGVSQNLGLLHEDPDAELTDIEVAYLRGLTLPVDVSFAIVNPSWKVLFHSDLRRSGQDDFLGACDNNPRLWRKLLKPDPENKPLDLTYLGKPYLARVSRLNLRPLWLIVLYQKEALHGLHLDLMLWTFAGLILLFSSLLFVTLFGSWIWALASGRRVWVLGSDERFLWGDLRLTGILALVSLWALNSLLLAPSESRALLAVVAPLTAIVFLVSRLIWKRARKRGRWIYVVRVLPLLVWVGFLALDLWLSASLWPAVLLLLALPLWLLKSEMDNLEIQWNWPRKGRGIALSIALFLCVATVLPTGLLGSALWDYDHAVLVWRNHEHLARASEIANLDWYDPCYWSVFEYALFDTKLTCTVPGLSSEKPEEAGQKSDNEHVGFRILGFLEKLHERLPLAQQRLGTLDEEASGLQNPLAVSPLSQAINGSIRSSMTFRSLRWELSSRDHLGQQAWFGWHWLVAGVGLSFFAMVCLTARHLLLIGLDPEDPRRAVPDLAADHLWWLTPLQGAKVSFPPDQEDTTWIYLDTDSGRKLLTSGELPPSAPYTVLVSAGATFDEPKSARLFLALLERLVSTGDTKVVVVATGLPEAGELLDLAFPPVPAEPAAPENTKKQATEEMTRADSLRILAHFTVLSCPEIRGKKHPEDLPSRETGSSSDVGPEAMLAREAGAHPQLRKVGGWLLKNPKCYSWRWKQLCDQLSLAAAFYYHWLWEGCSEPERIALFQLAHESVANPRAREALQSLLNKGLLRLAPHRGLQVFNRSFRRWVKRVGSSEDLAAKERERGGWLGARRTVLVAFVGLACFVMTTQQEIFESLGSLKEIFVSAVTILTAIVGAVAGLGRFFNKPLLGVDSE